MSHIWSFHARHPRSCFLMCICCFAFAAQAGGGVVCTVRSETTTRLISVTQLLTRAVRLLLYLVLHTHTPSHWGSVTPVSPFSLRHLLIPAESRSPLASHLSPPSICGCQQLPVMEQTTVTQQWVCLVRASTIELHQMAYLTLLPLNAAVLFSHWATFLQLITLLKALSSCC